MQPQRTKFGKHLKVCLARQHEDTFDNLSFRSRIALKGPKPLVITFRLIKMKADELALLWKPLDDKDLIEQVQPGLS